MYKFVSIDDYMAKYAQGYPNARVSPDGSEVVLSCANGEGDIQKHEAVKYIAENWSHNKVE